jgi:hypothetical protein
LRRCSKQCGLDRNTVRRWWSELNEHNQAFALSLRMRFRKLGRSVDFTDFWQNCLQTMLLSEAMKIAERYLAMIKFLAITIAVLAIFTISLYQ